MSFTHAIQNHDIEFLSEVPETLDYLSQKHRLILVTKGDIAEQSGKVERSGLKKHFAAVEIVAEKKPDVYAHLADKYDCTHRSTWMVGNSPKSDINPAMAAGLNAVFVPHGDTWISEHEEVNPAPRRTETAHRRPLCRTPRAFLDLFSCSSSQAIKDRYGLEVEFTLKAAEIQYLRITSRNAVPERDRNI